MAESWKLEVDVVKWEEEYDLWNSDNKLSQSEYYIVTCARAWYISSPSLWGNNNKEDMKIKWKQIGQKLRSKIHFIHIEHTLKNWKNRDFANAVILEFCARAKIWVQCRVWYQLLRSLYKFLKLPSFLYNKILISENKILISEKFVEV